MLNVTKYNWRNFREKIGQHEKKKMRTIKNEIVECLFVKKIVI
jgi:hypothetical protein